jgi:hypothetical protein
MRLQKRVKVLFSFLFNITIELKYESNILYIVNVNSLSAEEASASQSQQLSYQSPSLTQSSTKTQYGTMDKFLKDALVLPLHLILALDEVTLNI